MAKQEASGLSDAGEEPLFSVLTAGVTKDSAYAWIPKKGMPVHELGRLWRFQASEVDTTVGNGGAAGDSNRAGPRAE